MNTIRITKEFAFEMAHALHGYNGPCKNIHGHSYRLSVCVIGKSIQDNTDPKNGMVMDFGDLKKIVQTHVIDEFDHALVLNNLSPHKQMANTNNLFEKIVFVDYQPTCENLVIEIAQRIKNKLSNKIHLHHLKLHETASSFAEWYDSDQN